MPRETVKDREIRALRRRILEEQTRIGGARVLLRSLLDDLCGSKLPFETYENTLKRIESAIAELDDPRPLEKDQKDP